MTTRPNRRNPNPLFPILAGSLLLTTPLAVNVYTLAPLLRAQKIVSPFAAEAAVWVFGGLCVAAGLLFLALRAKPGVVKRSQGVLLLWITAALLFGVLELVFPPLLSVLPLNLQPHVPRPFGVLCQSSKRGLLPERYVAILGDSYAQGYGDWLMETNPWTNGPFQSAHLIADALRVDVVSFAHAGAGSIGALVNRPINTLRILRHRFDVEDPRLFLAYFYEGNDLADNLRELRRRGYFDRFSKVASEEFFDFLSSEVVHPLPGEDEHARLLGSKFVLNLVRNMEDRIIGRRRAPKRKLFPPSPQANRAIVGGEDRHLPARLQGPVLALSEDEIELSLRVFRSSLDYLMQSFPDAAVAVVYIPSVLSCYAMTGSVSTPASKGLEAIHPASVVRERGEAIAERVRRICDRSGAAFIDARDALRRAGSEELLHGPKDWEHFNRRGHEVLARTVVDQLGSGVRERLSPSGRDRAKRE